MSTQNNYLNNPLIHQNRRVNGKSAWVQQFDCTHLKPLIICRGPIRKEAMDVFDEMGINNYGILLSEKDSIIYRSALAPELRKLTDPSRVHRVPDYTGATKEERLARIDQIIAIAHDNGYNSIFAGYGFMAEDETMVAAMEQAGLNFIGPCSKTVHDAGLKDEAKRTALRVGVSVTPGIDNGTALTLLKKHSSVEALQSLAQSEGLQVDQSKLSDDSISLEDKADLVLAAGYAKGIDLYTVEELCETLTESVASMFKDYPENRIRLKAISGGGGKGQRILQAPSAYEGDFDAQVAAAAAKTPELVREIHNEVKTTGVGDNKNVLVELNIETTRHMEIQVIGNGDWSISLGGRDCSLQMHEQKLLEVSVTQNSLENAIAVAQQNGNETETKVLKQDLKTLQAMESEAANFGNAVGLDSVSTFECIVDRDKHFFMEMNTRIQVEHRVSELCASLEFVNPDDAIDSLKVHSLVEAMVLLAAHGPKLPKPNIVPRYNDSVEARLNATNDALQPHAGGVVEHWSDPIEGEIRDDQGISLHNPDTNVFMKYTLAGAYDSNIALLLTVGDSRTDTYQKMAEVIRSTQMSGRDLSTNIRFHYGLVHWFLGRNINARPTTRFIVPYLTAVGQLRSIAKNIDLVAAYAGIEKAAIARTANEEEAKALSGTLSHKYSLLRRPLEMLLGNGHLLSGWLSAYCGLVNVGESGVTWNSNPLQLLADSYQFLNMDYVQGKPASEMIWDHDHKLLSSGLDLYARLQADLGIDDWSELQSAISGSALDSQYGEEQAEQIRASHAGFQSGLDILALPVWIANQTEFFGLSVNDDLSICIPDKLTDPAFQALMAKELAPPPVASSNEILAASGGMFYPRETPEHEPFIEVGSHFEKGDPLYIVEVMKMFNKVLAPFAGTVEECCIDGDGVIISKGQLLFKIIPDEQDQGDSAEEQKAKRLEISQAFVNAIAG